MAQRLWEDGGSIGTRIQRSGKEWWELVGVGPGIGTDISEGGRLGGISCSYVD